MALYLYIHYKCNSVQPFNVEGAYCSYEVSLVEKYGRLFQEIAHDLGRFRVRPRVVEVSENTGIVRGRSTLRQAGYNVIFIFCKERAEGDIHDEYISALRQAVPLIHHIAIAFDLSIESGSTRYGFDEVRGGYGVWFPCNKNQIDAAQKMAKEFESKSRTRS